MDFEKFLKANGLDRYDRNARVYPALICLLPIAVVIALWLPKVWTLLGGLVSIVLTCGLLYTLVQIVRYRGREVENRLGRKVGRARTAVLLSHADSFVPAATKARYHDYLRGYGLEIPVQQDELSDPVAAHEAYRSAVDWLLVHTRSQAKSSMLLNENIAYGFRRNLLGLKPLAVAIVAVVLALNIYLIVKGQDESRISAAYVLGALLLLDLIAWLFVIRPKFVEGASVAYAQQFLALCEIRKDEKT